MIAVMIWENEADSALDSERHALPSASMSYILARANAYDAIRADEKFAAWAEMAGGVCLRGSWLHGLNHADSDCDLLVVGASVDDKMRAVNVHAGGVDSLCVTAGRFARLLAQADQVCVEARAYNGVLWRDGAVGCSLVESVRVPLPLLVAHYRGQAARDRAALASGRGVLGRLVKLARNVVRQEACADSLTARRPVACGARVWCAHLSLSACWRCAFPADRVQWCSVRGNETERGSLVILVPNTLFVVTFAVLATLAVLMLRRGAVAEAVCAAVAAVGCVLPLVAIGLAPAAREGNMVAAAVVVAAYILTYVFTFGGAAGMFVFSRARVKAALADVEGEGE